MQDAIFLHFLNRELHRAIGKNINIKETDIIVRCLLLATDVKLYGNFSMVSEGGYLTENTSSIIPSAIIHKELELVGATPTGEEFIISRQELYHFDSKRYPMYFEQAHKLENYLNASVINSTSMTSSLAFKIGKWLNTNELDIVPIVGSFDANKLEYIKKLIANTLIQRENKAMTVSLFLPILKKNYATATSNSIARLISSLYTIEYQELLEADIVSGINNIFVFDRLSKNFPYFDFPILYELLTQLGFIRFLSYDKSYEELLLVNRATSLHSIFSIHINELISWIMKKNSLDTNINRHHITRRRIIKEIKFIFANKKLQNNQMSFNDLKLNSIKIIQSIIQKNFSITTLYESISKTNKNPNNKTLEFIEDMQFDVALSFSGEKRNTVEKIAIYLKSRLNNNKLFYDKYYTAQLAKPNLDLILQKIYHNNSQLVVVFLSADYVKKEWCGLEWRTVRDLIKKKDTNKLMLINLDSIDIEGLFSIDGYIQASQYKIEEIGDFILERAKLLGCNII